MPKNTTVALLGVPLLRAQAHERQRVDEAVPFLGLVPGDVLQVVVHLASTEAHVALVIAFKSVIDSS